MPETGEITMAKQQYRQTRDNYTLHFNDDNKDVVWTTGNLRRFLRNLWNANPVLHKYNEDRDARSFAIRVARNAFVSMHNTQSNTVKFYLVHKNAGPEARAMYSGTISRNVMKSAKVLD